MARITEEAQQKNLERLGIEIQTKYLDGDTYIVKSTEEENSDPRSIQNGIVLEKLFFQKGKVLGKLNQYDSRVQYKFVTDMDAESDVVCPNCGYHGKGEAFVEGCPYCKTFYNMDYQDKSLGSKYYYDYVMKGEHYIRTTFLVDLVFSILVMFLYIQVTGRTFNGYDLAKVLVGGVLLGVAFFGIFYALDAFVLMLPVKHLKEKQNQKQKVFWEKLRCQGIEKNKFFNNFHYELRKYLYQNEKLIDYDIIDYVQFAEKNREDVLEVSITFDVRLVFLEENKLKTSEERKVCRMVHKNDAVVKLMDGMNIIQCEKCGASVHVTDGKCGYCGTEIGVYQEWILEENKN